MNHPEIATMIHEYAMGHGQNMTPAMLAVYAKHLSSFDAAVVRTALRAAGRERPDKMQTSYQLVKWCEAAQRDLANRHAYQPVIEPEPEPVGDCDPEQVMRAIRQMKESMRVK